MGLRLPNSESLLIKLATDQKCSRVPTKLWVKGRDPRSGVLSNRALVRL